MIKEKQLLYLCHLFRKTGDKVIFFGSNKKQRNKRQGNEATSANNVILSLIISLRRRMKYLYAEFNSQR